MLLNKFTLLYIEDDKQTQEAISMILEDEVKELYLASNGQEGLDIYNEKNPDIVLTDINMPLIDGLELSKRIKDMDYYKPIVLLTAFCDMEFLKKTIDIGIDKYMVKPVLDFQKLFDTLEGVAKILQNNIDKKNLEDILQVQSKLTAIGEMLSNIAHQWRQPLNIISSISSSIKVKMDFEEQLKKDELFEFSDNIMKQTQYLSQTIDDFRDFFNNDNGIKRDFSLKESLHYIQSLIKDSYKNQFITIENNIEDVIIHQNQNQLTQALINIFNNAKDALTNIKDEKLVFVNTIKENNKVIIQIKDNAGGIPQEVLPRIFEPYFTTKHQSTGTGIGLYITHKIITNNFAGSIKAENCTYTYENKKYNGALFTIVLDLAR